MFALFAAIVACNGPPVPENVVPAQNGTLETIYSKITDVWFMTFLVIFLMVFIKKYEWAVALASFISIFASFVTYALIYYFAESKAWNERIAAESICCAITCVVAIGSFVGTIKTPQYYIVGILFACCYYLNQWLVASGHVLTGVADPGCAITIHMFAAYWSMAFGLVIREKRVLKWEFPYTTHSVTWAWFAGAILFVLWPSFVSLYYSGEKAIEAMNVCYMSGVGSGLSCYITAYLIGKKKVAPVEIAYCILAGMVGTSSALFMLGTWPALLVGAICGVFSILSFKYLQPFFVKKWKYLDVMGVHNLHGVCSWISVIVGVVCCYIKGHPGHWTIAGAAISLGVSLSTGAVCGLICKYTMFGEIPENELFDDFVDFEWPQSAIEARNEKVCEL